MEERSFCARHKADIIVGISFVLLLLVIYFSPSQISVRHNRALTRFPEDGYVAVEDSQQYAATAVITLSLADYRDEYAPDKSFLTGQLHLEIYNIGREPLRDFNWIGELGQETQERLAANSPWLPPVGINTRYSMLLAQVFRTKYDMYPRDATLPDHEPGGRRQPTSGVVYDHQGLSFWYSETAGDLDAVLACAEKPIKLKLLHEGGTDYLLVYPVVDTSKIIK